VFNVEKTTQDVVQWIRDWFEENGKGCNAVIGISGGKDSSVVAALCVEALGKNRVIGVLMPNGEQADIDWVRNYLENLGHFDEILITRAGGVISSHCGPGTLGVLFLSGE